MADLQQHLQELRALDDESLLRSLKRHVGSSNRLNALVLAHCTVPRTLVEGYRLRSHFESGLGIGIQGRLPLGPVTLLRIGGSMMDALWLAEGEVVSTGDAENLCRTQVRVALSRGDVGDLLSAPLGNHIVLVYGHHADRMASWWESML